MSYKSSLLIINWLIKEENQNIIENFIARTLKLQLQVVILGYCIQEYDDASPIYRVEILLFVQGRSPRSFNLNRSRDAIYLGITQGEVEFM